MGRNVEARRVLLDRVLENNRHRQAAGITAARQHKNSPAAIPNEIQVAINALAAAEKKISETEDVEDGFGAYITLHVARIGLQAYVGLEPSGKQHSEDK
jgi:hypothetical protein